MKPTPSRAVVHASEAEIEAPYFVESHGNQFSVRQILGVLRRNVWVILTTMAIAVGVAAYLVSRQTDVFTATAMIRLVDRNQVAGGVAPETPVSTSPDPLASEVMVIQGRPVMGEVVDREGLRLFSPIAKTPPKFVDEVEVTLPADQRGWFRLQFDDQGVAYGPTEDRRKAAYGETIHLTGVSFVVPRKPGLNEAVLVVIPRENAIDWVYKDLEVTPLYGTGGVILTFTSTNAQVAPRIVNGMAEVYQKVNAETASQRIRRQRVFLEEQLASIDSLPVY